MKRTVLFLFVLIISVAYGCGGSDNDNDFALEAIAGPDQNVKVGDTVTLDGSDSYTSSSLTLSYKWSFDSIPDTSNATLSDPNAVKPTFDADVVGEYTLTLEVSDPLDRSSTDFVIITATSDTTNATPVADAGTDQSIATGDTVTLDGIGTDADGDTLTYSWTLAAPSNSSAVLDTTIPDKPTFVADQDGVYIAELIVNDGTIDSTPSTVTVTATSPPTNAKPVANAGADQDVNTGDTVTLDGSGSTDADLDSLSYLWSFNSTPSNSAVLDKTIPDQPTFVADQEGVYVIQLIVNDGTVDSDPDTVTVTATSPTTPTGPVGTLDTTFDGDGVVLFDHTSGRNSRGNSIAVDDSFGTVFVAGQGPNSNLTITRSSMYLWKYLSTGIQDYTAVWDNPNGANSAAFAFGVALDDPQFGPNMYVTGATGDNYSTNPSTTITSMAIWKFNPNGTLNTTFNAPFGFVTKTGTRGGVTDRGYDIFVDDLLNVYVTGTSNPAGSLYPDMVIWKYTQNGALDTSFGGGSGFVFHANAAGGNNSDVGSGIASDSDGNIYVAGYSVGATSSSDMVVWKYTANGQLDTNFGGGDGFVVYDNAAGGGTVDVANDIAIDSSGNIYVTGYSNSLSSGTNYDMVIWKLTSDGSLDTNFGNNGIIVDDNAPGSAVTISQDRGDEITLDSLGNIYVTGDSANDLIIWKYNPDGTPFTSFGNNGVVIYGDASQQQGLGLTLQGDDKVFVTGHDDGDMIILKYE